MNNKFLSCDWGTSSFRLRLVDAASSKVLATSTSDEGVASVYGKWQSEHSSADRIGFYCTVLQRHIDLLESQLQIQLSGLPIVISGMASSTLGMQELPYQPLPFSLPALDFVYAHIAGQSAFAHNIILVSGARTDNDVMRGEEVQLAGCIVNSTNQRQVIVFPGTHSKHVFVENNMALDFKTYMTGEFFNLLAANSILSKSVRRGGTLQEENNRNAFSAGVLESQNGSLLHQAFKVRTQDLFKRFTHEENYWFLSGLVIGTEVNALLQEYSGPVTIVSDDNLAQTYQHAFEVAGIQEPLHMICVEKALINAHRRIFEKFAS